jgi:hypothetical protein
MSAKNIKNLIIGGLTVFLFTSIFIFLPITNIKAQTYNFINDSGLNVAGERGGYDVGDTSTSLEDIISSVIYAVLGLVGVIFLGMVIYGGFTWMTAQGNEEKVKQANNIVMSSLFGLIITLAAYAISTMAVNYFWK